MAFDIDMKNLFTGHFPATEQTIYQVPNGKSTLIRTIRIINESDSTRRVNLRIQKGTTWARLIPYDFRLQGHHVACDDDQHVMTGGDKLLASADMGGTVTCKINGVEEKV